MKMPATNDAGLNMTPMIDIVFQLILFFLFNLKFKSIDFRIESSLPKDRGVVADPSNVPPENRIKVSLFRLDAEDKVAARTKVRLASQEWYLPPVNAPVAERDAAFARIRARIESLRSESVKGGEIDAKPPYGGLVPHADVVGVLDAFLEAGVKDVSFEGAADPMPHVR